MRKAVPVSVSLATRIQKSAISARPIEDPAEGVEPPDLTLFPVGSFPKISKKVCRRAPHPTAAGTASSAERAKEANVSPASPERQRMLGYQGPAQRSPQSAPLPTQSAPHPLSQLLRLQHPPDRPPNIVRLTYMFIMKRRATCGARIVPTVRGYRYKRSHLVALRPTKISAHDPPQTWWSGERCGG